MIFKLKTNAAMPALNLPTAKKPAATTASNGQLTGLAKSIVDKEAMASQPAASVKAIDTPKVDMTANKNDASLALGKLNPDIKAESIGNLGAGDTTVTNQYGGTTTLAAGASAGKGDFGRGISNIKDMAKLPANAAPTLRPPRAEGAAPVATINTPIAAEEQRAETNTESDIIEAPPTTDVGLQEVPTGPGNTGLDTSFESTIGIARTALEKMLNENADPALRAEAEASLREAEAAGVKDTRKSQALGATGLSGAGGRLESDVRKLGKRETVTAMDEYDRAARQEETKRLQEGLGLSGDIQRAELERLAVERARKQLGTVEELPNGTLVEKQPDGSSRTTAPNGDVTIIKANGDKEITHPDGSKEMVLADTQGLQPFTGQTVTARTQQGANATPTQYEVRYGDPGSATADINGEIYTDAEGHKFRLYTDRNTGYKFLMPA